MFVTGSQASTTIAQVNQTSVPTTVLVPTKHLTTRLSFSLRENSDKAIQMHAKTCGLVPLHPLARKNDLVNYVKFLGLAHVLRLATFKIFCATPTANVWICSRNAKILLL